MEIFGIAVTILAGILTYQAWKNGRWMKQAHQDTQNLIREMHRDTVESFSKMDETSKEMRRATDETLKEMRRATDETLKEIDETLKEIARLIVAEGERTRQLIKT